jgi:hypothetical protein
MSYRGRIQHGTVILEDPLALPDGTEVEVAPVKADVTPGELQNQPTWGEVFKDLIGTTPSLPEDMADNHDHYIHGAPKR